jgi:hypothetical protein
VNAGVSVGHNILLSHPSSTGRRTKRRNQQEEVPSNIGEIETKRSDHFVTGTIELVCTAFGWNDISVPGVFLLRNIPTGLRSIEIQLPVRYW